MAQFNLSTAVELSKRLYPNGLDSILYEFSPLYALIKKWKGFGGEGKYLTWEIGTGGGSSSRFANAQANKSAGSYKRPFITRAKEYALASMDGEALEATEGDKFAIAEIFKTAMDNALYNVNRAISVNLFRNGGGARGRVASGTTFTTATVTLETGWPMVGFDTGMVIQTASTDGTSGSVNSGTGTIVGTDPIARTITLDVAWDVAFPGISGQVYIFRDGDFNNVIKGLAAWLPTSAPGGGDNFFGVDRSTNPTKLAGVRYAPSAGQIREILIDCSALLWDIGGRPTHVVMNSIDAGQLAKELETDKVFDLPTDKPGMAVKSMVMPAGNGELKIVQDPQCPRNRAYMLTLDKWELWSLKDVPRILDRDGNKTLREANADADELRVGGYLQLVCTAPRDNAVITLPSQA